MLEESLQVLGKLSITLTGPDGKVKEERILANLIVQVGKNYLASAILASASTPFTYMALGTGVTAPALGDTTLTTELVRQAFSSSSLTTNVALMTTTYGPGVGTGALTEAGILNAPAAGILLSHVTFAVVNKGVLDTITIAWTVTVG
jgi:hypothetical protein